MHKISPLSSSSFDEASNLVSINIIAILTLFIILSLIKGASIKSLEPVLYVQTDFNTFRYLVILDQQTNDQIDIVEYRVQSSSIKGFDLLHKWLYLIQSMRFRKFEQSMPKSTENRFSWYNKIKTVNKFLSKRSKEISRLKLPTIDNDRLTTVYSTPKISHEQIVNAYNEEEIICDRSRTGIVYKIKIDDKPYALKVPKNDKPVKFAELIKELNDEVRIYKRLESLYVYLTY